MTLSIVMYRCIDFSFCFRFIFFQCASVIRNCLLHSQSQSTKSMVSLSHALTRLRFVVRFPPSVSSSSFASASLSDDSIEGCRQEPLPPLLLLLSACLPLLFRTWKSSFERQERVLFLQSTEIFYPHCFRGKETKLQ